MGLVRGPGARKVSGRSVIILIHNIIRRREGWENVDPGASPLSMPEDDAADEEAALSATAATRQATAERDKIASRMWRQYSRSGR